MLNTSCKKLIDGPDHSTLSTDLIFETARDLDNLLYGAYGAIGNGGLAAGYWKVFPELLADGVLINVDDNNPNDPYKMVYDRNLTQAQYPELWRTAYVAVQNSNTVIYAVENNLITRERDAEYTDSNRDKMLGEAYFIRALCYFELVKLYGQQYQYTTLPVSGNSGTPSPANSIANSGIILRTKPVLNVTDKDQLLSQGRATVEETYQQIISDLKKAEVLLPPTSLQGVTARRGRATSFAASAILARVYFQQNDFPNAMDAISRTIGSSPGVVRNGFGLLRTSIPPATQSAAQASTNVVAPFLSNNVNATSERLSENIFDLVSTTNFSVNGVVRAKYFFSASSNPHLSISNAFRSAAAFNATANTAGVVTELDARKAALIDTPVTVLGKRYFTKKFNQSLMNVPIIRSPELVLTRAEINATIANSLAPASSQAYLDALEDLKVVRSRAVSNTALAYPSQTLIPPAKILAEVRLERLRELAFEGDRLWSLKRMGALTLATSGTIENNIPPGDRSTAFLPWTSNKLLFKIPDAEIKNSNNRVVQNPD